MGKPAYLHTTRKENFKTRKFRFLMNCYPMYFGTGGKIIFWSADSKEIQVRLKLNLWTYNLVGTMFGGSMFAAADPFYMIMLHNCLGPTYVVWDKSANIRFRKPGKQKLYCKFEITDQLLTDIKETILEKQSTEIVLPLQWLDKDGAVYAEMERTIYIADKKYYEQRKGTTQSVKLKGL